MPTWRLLDTGSNTGAHNMALDEELLARAQAGEPMPVLRFYTWEPSAVSVGRFQNMKQAVNRDACRTHGFDVVRRVTGGRAVLHRKELTYSIVARTDNPLFPPGILGTYHCIAAGLVAGLRNLGLPAEVVTRASRHAGLVRKKPNEAACFSSPSWYEIVVGGRKIIGSAQRRDSHAFLQHGSILLDYDPVLEAEVIAGGCCGDRVTSICRELKNVPDLEEIRKALERGFSEALNVSFQVRSFPAA